MNTQSAFWVPRGLARLLLSRYPLLVVFKIQGKPTAEPKPFWGPTKKDAPMLIYRGCRVLSHLTQAGTPCPSPLRIQPEFGLAFGELCSS